MNSGNLQQVGEHLIAKANIVRAELGNAILRTFESGNRGFLNHRRRIGGGLTLQLVDLSDYGSRAKSVSGAPSCHRVGLRKRADAHEMLASFCHAACRLSVAGEIQVSV